MGLTGKPDQELERIQATKTDAELQQERIRNAFEAVVDAKNWIELFLEAFQERDYAEVQRLWNFRDPVMEQLSDGVDHLRDALRASGVNRTEHGRRSRQ